MADGVNEIALDYSALWDQSRGQEATNTKIHLTWDVNTKNVIFALVDVSTLKKLMEIYKAIEV